MKNLFLILALIAAGSVYAAKPGSCEAMCEEDLDSCVKECKEGIKKINPKAVKYCEPKCKEMKKQCEKDCDDEAHGRKVEDY